MKKIFQWAMAAALIICGASMLTSCDNEDNNIVPTPDEPVVLNCAKPDYLKAGDKPVLCGFPGGHGDVNLPLVMGANVTIDVRNDGATLQFNIDGDQQQVNTASITAPATPAAVRMRLAGKIQ